MGDDVGIAGGGVFHSPMVSIFRTQLALLEYPYSLISTGMPNEYRASDITCLTQNAPNPRKLELGSMIWQPATRGRSLGRKTVIVVVDAACLRVFHHWDSQPVSSTSLWIALAFG